ncbi:MAG: TolC family protein [Nitrospinaceae bacterium]
MKIKSKFCNGMLTSNTVSLVMLGFFLMLAVPQRVEADGKPSIPPLRETIGLALQKQSVHLRPAWEVKYLARKYYYRIQYQLEQLDIAEEVKKHFEKAVKKSEEKFNSGEEDISQSDITKLKLGLNGTLNSIIDLKNEIHIAKLWLGNLTGLDVSADSKMEERSIRRVPFPFKDLDEFLRDFHFQGGGASLASENTETDPVTGKIPGKISHQLKEEDLFVLEKAFIEIQKSSDKLKLAQQSRKITRALLVTEVANYDFGIGDSQDLFEALIIYTRVLQGYYETVYNFNLAVAALERAASSIRSGREGLSQTLP